MATPTVMPAFITSLCTHGAKAGVVSTVRDTADAEPSAGAMLVIMSKPPADDTPEHDRATTLAPLTVTEGTCAAQAAAPAAIRSA